MRGGRLFLLLGVVIAAAAALLLFYFMQPQAQAPAEVPTTPTAEPRVRVVVARIDLPANAIITDTETFLTTDEIRESEFNAQPGVYFTNPSEVLNKVTIRPLIANERIKKADVVDGGLSLLIPTAEPDQPRPKAIPFQVNNLTGVADLVTPGDFVDLIVTFKLEVKYIRPGLSVDTATGEITITFSDDVFIDSTTKTLVQNIQVLKIMRQRVDPDATPTPEGAADASAPPPTNPDGSVAGSQSTGGAPSGDNFVSGNWIVILAVNDQEAEIVRYSLAQASGMALVLRGRGDADVEQTLGVTLDILAREFGLPLPVPPPPFPPDVGDLTPTPGL
jgi:pilus assembly protein CpaB